MLNRLDRPGKAEAAGLEKGAGEREGRPAQSEVPEARPDRSEAPESRFSKLVIIKIVSGQALALSAATADPDLGLCVHQLRISGRFYCSGCTVLQVLTHFWPILLQRLSFPDLG